MIRPHPGPTDYPDLHDGIDEQIISGDLSVPVLAEVQNGWVTFTDPIDKHSVTISEWDFGNFVEEWLDARMDQKFADGDL